MFSYIVCIVIIIITCFVHCEFIIRTLAAVWMFNVDSCSTLMFNVQDPVQNSDRKHMAFQMTCCLFTFSAPFPGGRQPLGVPRDAQEGLQGADSNKDRCK